MNEDEFENFYNEHSRPLWSFVRRLSNSAEVADDVAQESFLKFLGSPPQKSIANQKAYLYRIATNLTYDHFRREGRRKTNSLSDSGEEVVYEPFAATSTVAGEVGLAQVFDKLKMQERALLWLAYVEEHTHDEIADMLGLKRLSVRVLLFRARRKLVNLLGERGYEKLKRL